MTDFLILSGWVLALWFAAHWYSERDRANLAEFDADARAEQIRCAEEIIDAQDCQLRAAHSVIARLRDANRALALEKPMIFGDLPMYHAAHLHKSPDDRQLWLMWDN